VVSRRRTFGFLVAIHLVVGCASSSIVAVDTTPSQPTSEASWMPTPAPTMLPTEVPEPTRQIVNSPRPASSLPPPEFVDGLEASNAFWEQFYDTCWFGAFPDEVSSSLAEITRDSDLVVRGRIVDIVPRGTNGFAVVAITELLKGEPLSREPGTVEIRMSRGPDVDLLRSKIPAHDVIWFALHESTLDPDRASAPTSYRYYATDYPQMSILRDINGKVQVIMPNAIESALGRDHYPVPLDGTRFEALVERVRDMADSATGTQVLARVSGPPPAPDNRFDAC
jgi:hypothetical protein